MVATFNINQDDVIAYTKKLAKLHKSALPLAIRSTLNDVAFDSKKILPSVFSKEFTVRKKSFIRSHTAVNKVSNTFEVNRMVSEIGVIAGKSLAGNQLAFQERGGSITSSFMPFDEARVSKNRGKLVSKRNYTKNKIHKATSKQDYIKKAYKMAKAKSKDFIWYKDLIIRIDGFGGGSRLNIKMKVLYSTKESKISLKAHSFIRKSSFLAQQNAPKLYKEQAEFRIRKEMKKFMR